MKIEIWSDVACPFCYIGKRRFETALAEFDHRDKVEVIWKSFQLDPEAQYSPGQTIYDHLAERKGWSRQQARETTAHVIEMARGEGLQYDFDKLVPTNTFDAHRFTHLAAQHGLQDKAEEKLFHVYFTEGENIADPAVLTQLGVEIGLEANAVQQMLHSDDYANEVQTDITEAQNFGIRGVPFFVFNRQYAVSGAQASANFSQVLQQSWAAWEKENPRSFVQIANGEVCTPDGECA